MGEREGSPVMFVIVQLTPIARILGTRLGCFEDPEEVQRREVFCHLPVSLHERPSPSGPHILSVKG